MAQDLDHKPVTRSVQEILNACFDATNNALKISGTVNGNLNVSGYGVFGGGYSSILTGDLSLARNGGTGGYIYFGSGGHIIGFDGTRFLIGNGSTFTEDGVVTLGGNSNGSTITQWAADNSTAYTLRINATQANVTASDIFMSFNSTSGAEGTIAGTAVAGVLAYNTFTGSHWSQSNTIIPVELDPVIREVVDTNPDGTPVLDEDGNPVMVQVERKRFTSDVEPGAVLVSIDEMCAWEGEVANHLPKCAVSTSPMDKAVYGVYGGHDPSGDIQVLALGASPILVCNEGGNIQVGDFLCSSSQPGRAMKYTGNDMRVVVAKARQSFSGTTGKIACTLMAG